MFLRCYIQGFSSKPAEMAIQSSKSPAISLAFPYQLLNSRGRSDSGYASNFVYPDVEKILKQSRITYILCGFYLLLILNFIHIIQYSKLKISEFNTLIGTSSYKYRSSLGEINLLSGTILVPLVVCIKFINNDSQPNEDYWMQFLFLSLLNSLLILSNVSINSMKFNTNVKLSIWSLVSILLMAFNQYLTDELLMKSSFIYLIFSQFILYFTIHCFEKNFTLSEASIITQLISGLVLDYYYHYFDQSKYEMNLSEAYILVRAGLVFAFIGVYSTTLICKLFKYNWSGIVGIIIGCVLPWILMIHPSLTLQLEKDPFVWIIEYILESKTTQYTIVFWIICLFVSIVYINTQTRFKTLNSKRKFFHYLSCLMFIPIYSINNDFLQIALMVGLGLMLLSEVYRLSKLPGYQTLNLFINPFRDNKDIGEFVWAHVYLLLGCSFTIWLGELGGLSGVISLGLADSTASVVGKSLGKTKWFGSKKSVEGSLTFVVCSTVGLIYSSRKEFTHYGALVAKSSFYSALLEAVTYENDNLILPLYLWVLLNLP